VVADPAVFLSFIPFLLSARPWWRGESYILAMFLRSGRGVPERTRRHPYPLYSEPQPVKRGTSMNGQLAVEEKEQNTLKVVQWNN